MLRGMMRAWISLGWLSLVLLAASCGDETTPAGDGGSGAGNTSSSGGGGSAPDKCGDGIVQASEACDDGGESDMCDGDCSVVQCGDGTRNATAGEECDDVVESAACNADCTSAVCGDGKINVTANEACDDGNDIAGDGCSNFCQIEGTCQAPEPLDLTDDGSGVLRASVAAATGAEGSVGIGDCDGQTELGAGPDRVYSFEISVASNVSLSLFGTGWDPIARVLTSPCDVTSEVLEDGEPDGCSDVGDVGAFEEMTFSNLPPGVYYIVVDGAQADDLGPFTLDVEAYETVVDCQGAAAKFPGQPSGVFTIDPDGAGGNPPFDAYCDLETDGGGWTLIARFSNADAANWMLDSGAWWYVKAVPEGDSLSPATNGDMISPAFWSLAASELKITRSDGVDDAHLLMTTNTCLAGQDFRGFITSFGDFQNSAVWGSDSVAATCLASIGAVSGTAGFAQASCAGEIGAPNSISFWADWSAGDGAVMMIGGGGTACNRADHGIGVTEANDASFNFTPEADFGDDAGSTVASYALNLFVR